MAKIKQFISKNKIAVVLLLFFTVFLSGCVSINSSNNYIEREVDKGYNVTNYHVDIVVNENNSYNITEVLDVSFGSLSQYGLSRGIYRYIPYMQTITIENSETNKQTMVEYTNKITNIKAYETNTNTHYNLLENENGNKLIRIQENNSVNGKTRQYKYEYTYHVGYDRIEHKDFVYLNLLGYDINTTVNNFSFKITLPKGFNELDEAVPTPYFYVGKYAESSTPSSVVSYNFEDNVISGNVSRVLQPFESVTINLDLPNNYFSQVTKPNNTINYVVIGAIIAVAIAVVFLSMLLNKNKQIVSPVEFYPPNDMDSVLMSYTITGRIGIKKMTSLVIYFASKGYLNIIEEDKKLSLQKIKNLPKGAPSYQQIVFDALFENNNDDEKKQDKKETKEKELKQKTENSSNTNPIIPLSELEETAGIHFQNAQVIARTSFGGRLKKLSVLFSVIIMAISILPALLFTINYSHNINNFTRLIPTMFAIIVFGLMYLLVFFTSKQAFFSKSTKVAKVLPLVAFGVVLLIMKSVFYENVLDPLMLKYFVFIPTLLATFLAPKVVMLNNKYTDSFGAVLGFRKTLLLTEANRMKVLLKDDPSYFYNILPYAYVLDITDEFSKKFEGLAMQQPSWYHTNQTTVFDIIVFNRLLTMSMANFSAKSIAAMAPKGGGSGGSGGFGGGFSGGGFGGGGIGRA